MENKRGNANGHNKKTFEFVLYDQSHREKLLAFLEICLPESGRRLELIDRHRAYLDVEKNYTKFWCLLDDSNIIGTVAIKCLDEKSCELKSLYLLEQYHGYGYGRFMLQKAVIYAKENGYEKMFLDSLSTSEKAIALYKKAGFVDTERYNQNERADVFKVLDLKNVPERLWVGPVMPESPLLSDYLTEDAIVNFSEASIQELSNALGQNADGELAYIKAAFEFVRDRVSHSADVDEDVITCSASEVLREKHGICFAKSNLLVALLRAKAIPAGFCYQKLILDDEAAPVLIYHGLVGVFLREQRKWIRLDARGNKEGVNAQFSTGKEQLAFSIRPEKGEADYYIVYAKPDEWVLEKLLKYKTRTELWGDLPIKLKYIDVKK